MTELATKKRFLSAVFMLSLITFCFQSYAQSEATEKQLKDIISYSNEVYGPDDLLINGELYTKSFLRAKSHPFYLADKWSKGKLFIKEKCYDNIEMRIDVETDALILKAKTKLHEYPLKLNHNMIDSFYIQNSFFVNSTHLNLDKNYNSRNYVELVYRGNFKTIVQYEKSFVAYFTGSTPYGYYSQLGSDVYISRDGKLYYVSTKKRLLQFFKPFKNEIKKYLRKQKINYKKISSQELHNLFKYCDEISSV